MTTAVSAINVALRAVLAGVRPMPRRLRSRRPGVAALRRGCSPGRPRVHARQRRERPVLHGRADGRRRGALRLRQRRRSRRVPGPGRRARPTRPRIGAAASTAGCFATTSIAGADGRDAALHRRHRRGRRRRCSAYGMGAAVGDYDNDGDLDLFVTAFGAETLYRNNGNGTFTDVTARPASSDPRWSTSAAFLDYDRDGDLDLFVANYLDFTLAGNKLCHDAVGARDYCSPRAYRPVPDRLYRNEGGGRFTDVTERAGISKADGAGLGVVDRRLQRRRLARSLRRQRRHAEPAVDQPAQRHVRRRRACCRARRSTPPGNPEGSMGIASGDFDADGDEDLFVTNIVGETFALYVNDGRGNFDDARAQGRAGARRPRRSPASAPTGSTTTTTAGSISSSPTAPSTSSKRQRGQPFPFRMRNQLFRNTGAGRFEETSQAGGPRSRAPRSAAAPPSATSTTTATSTSSSRTTTGRCGCCSIRRGRHATTGCRCACSRPQGNRFGVRRAGRRRARRASRRCGAASGPTAAICRRATRACTSASARRPTSTRSSSSGPTACANAGRTFASIASSRYAAGRGNEAALSVQAVKGSRGTLLRPGTSPSIRPPTPDGHTARAGTLPHTALSSPARLHRAPRGGPDTGRRPPCCAS